MSHFPIQMAYGKNMSRRLLIISLVIVLVGGAIGLVALGNNDEKEPAPVSPTPTSAPTTSSTTLLSATPTTQLEVPSVSVASSSETAYLTNIKTETTETGERAIFIFERQPGYTVAYSDGPVSSSSSEGTPVEVAGSATVKATFELAASVKLTGGYVKTYGGKERFSPAGTSLIQEFAAVKDSDGQLTWAIGLDKKVPFTVTTTSNPNQVIIEFQRS